MNTCTAAKGHYCPCVPRIGCKVQQILEAFLGIYRTGHCEVLTPGSLADLEMHSRHLLSLLKDTFKAHEGQVYSAPGFCFPKSHMLLHFSSLVHEYGSSWICDAACWETSHQYTKGVYL